MLIGAEAASQPLERDPARTDLEISAYKGICCLCGQQKTDRLPQLSALVTKLRALTAFDSHYWSSLLLSTLETARSETLVT